MYCQSSGFPGMVVLKIGTSDDLEVQEGLGPEVDQFCRTRVGWWKLWRGRGGRGETIFVDLE